MSPSDVYNERLRDREARTSQLRGVSRGVGNLRLSLVAALIAAGWMAFHLSRVSPGWMALPVVLFTGAVLYHAYVRRQLDRACRAAEFYRGGLARIEDRWQGTGQTGERFNDPHHVYASDLDLFGKGSLFELLSIARTRMGEETLARWLLAPSPVADLLDRHAGIADLRARLDLREHLALLGDAGAVVVHPERLLQWTESPNLLTQPWLPWMGVLLAILAAVTTFIWSSWGIATPALAILLVQGAVLMSLKRRIGEVLGGTENAFEDLKVLSALIERLENEPFGSPPLQALMQKLTSHTLAASRVIGRFSTIANLAESRRNIILGILEVPLMYSLHVALSAERWRRAHGTMVRSWLQTVAEIEALLSLAGYSYEHPSDPFPQFSKGQASLHGEELGHPLLHQERCVRNTVSIVGDTRVLLVSGSNMSGKSTLLRTTGVNAVLAMAGAPVRARLLRMTPLQIGASIRINDSLHEGSSRFYAEITRLRQLVDLQNHEPALLFLLDELLQGTNSHDRGIGAAGVLHAFVQRGGIGLTSTHDLALTAISGLPEGALQNVHLQDDIVDGRLVFDFRLRKGVVTKSNAIALMRSIGLNV